MTPTRTRQLRHDERGSVSIWAVLIVAAFTLIVGISVDLTGQIAAKQRAAQNDYPDVEKAADELLQLIDKKEGREG